MTTDHFDSDEFKQGHAASERTTARLRLEAGDTESPVTTFTLPDEPFTPLTPNETLLKRTFEQTVWAVSRGNKISHEHQLALRATAKLLVEQATGTIRGLWALPAFTGFGKSCAISSFAAALLLEKRAQEIPLLICQGTIQALGEMKADIESAASPDRREGLVGVYHTMGDRSPVKSIARSELGEYPILLVPHARLLTGKDLRDFMEFDGLRRHLIHDESMIRNEGAGVQLGLLRYNGAGLMKLLGQRTALREFLETALSRIEAGVEESTERRATGDHTTVSVQLPEISEKAVSIGLTQVREALKGQKEDPVTTAMRKFLDVMPGKTVRIVANTNDIHATVIQYRTLIHADITDATIFDASASIRELTRLDPKIKDATTAPVDDGRPAFVYRGNLRDLKSWERVKLVWWQKSGGKSIVRKDYVEARKKGEVCFRSRHLAERIKKHEGERILIVTFRDEEMKNIAPRDRGSKDYWKRTPFRFQHELESDLRELGVDLKAQVVINGEVVDRFVWMTWGKVTGRNDARDCTVAYLHGVILRDRNRDLLPTALGQLDDIHADLDARMDYLEQSEAAHEIYQAVSRVACREMEGHLAKPCTVYVTHYNWEAIDIATSEMPGVQIQVSTKAPGESAGDKRISEKRTRQVEAFVKTFKAVTEPAVASTVIKERTIKGNRGLFEGAKADSISVIMTEAAQAAGWFKEVAGSRHWVFGGDPF